MCGIAGIYNYKSSQTVNKDVLISMRDTMIHRGPDGGDVWIDELHPIGFTHRRLSIVDLSTIASQPMRMILYGLLSTAKYIIIQVYELNYLKMAIFLRQIILIQRF